jgi:hypothetical protein
VRVGTPVEGRRAHWTGGRGAEVLAGTLLAELEGLGAGRGKAGMRRSWQGNGGRWGGGAGGRGVKTLAGTLAGPEVAGAGRGRAGSRWKRWGSGGRWNGEAGSCGVKAPTAAPLAGPEGVGAGRGRAGSQGGWRGGGAHRCPVGRGAVVWRSRQGCRWRGRKGMTQMVARSGRRGNGVGDGGAAAGVGTGHSDQRGIALWVSGGRVGSERVRGVASAVWVSRRMGKGGRGVCRARRKGGTW